MTVHVHRDLTEIVIGETRIKRDGKKRKTDLDTERTWAFRGPDDFERRILTDVEFTSNHPGGVPLTHEEQLLKVDQTAEAQVQTARMAQALAQMIDERVKTGA